MDSISNQVIVAFSFGVIFVIALMVIAIKFPNPTPFQYNVFRIILSLAAAGVGAMIPGFITAKTNDTSFLFISAGGALAVFGIVYLVNPAKLLPHPELAIEVVQQIPPIPERLPNGEPFPTSKQQAFNEVWLSLISLEDKGQDLWELVTKETLKNFTEVLFKTRMCVRENALFFNQNDYESLNELLKVADFYLRGKERLSEIYGKSISRKLPILKNFDDEMKDEIVHQIQQNKKWLTRYRNLLAKIRENLHSQVTN